MGPALTISADEIDRAFAPYVIQQYATDDPEWQSIVARLERKQQRRFDQFGRNELPARDRTLVEQQYDEVWSRSLEEQLAGRPTPFEWSRGAYVAHSSVRKRVHN